MTNPMGEAVTDRALWRVAGKDAISFLQNLVSNDLLPLEKAPGIRWAALLTPQGKYLVDFFVIRRPEDDGALLLDLPQGLAADTLRRLTLYKLRADVVIAAADLHIQRGIGAVPEGAMADPRHDALGWRLYSEAMGGPRHLDWDGLRIAHLVPEWPGELRVDDSYILEQGFERLHGVDFRKGCYVGQEVTARMKHKTELRKGLVRLQVLGGEAPAPGTPITMADGREAGILGTVSGGRALAHMRFDRIQAPLQAGDLTLGPETASPI